MSRSAHPTWERLLDYAESRLSAEEARSVQSHVETCDRCGGRLRDFDRLRDDFAAGDAGDAPESWLLRAESRMPLARRGADGPRITFDSRVDALPGMRAGLEGGRQYLVEGGGVEVEVSLAPEGGDEPWPLSGQLLAEDATRARDLDVDLVEDGRVVATVRATAHGEFLFAHRPRGPFRLRLRGPGVELETPDLAP